MTEFHGVLDLQVESLIDTLGARQKTRCGEIERDAERRAKHLLDDNRRKLRKRLHRAVDDGRQRRNAALLDTERRIETAERSRTQERYGDFLEEAWPLLVDELGGPSYNAPMVAPCDRAAGSEGGRSCRLRTCRR